MHYVVLSRREGRLDDDRLPQDQLDGTGKSFELHRRSPVKVVARDVPPHETVEREPQHVRIGQIRDLCESESDGVRRFQSSTGG